MKATRRGFLKMATVATVGLFLIDPRDLVAKSPENVQWKRVADGQLGELVRSWVASSYMDMFTNHSSLFAKMMEAQSLCHQ